MYYPKKKKKNKYLKTVVLFLFALLYPLLLSVYLFLPLFVGFFGYVAIIGLEKEKKGYILASLLYFFNLDLNLSLPIVFAPLAILIVYLGLYDKVRIIRECKTCVAFLSVLFIDVVYLALIKAYDFVFQTVTIKVDMILLYTLLVDLLTAVAL